MIKITFVSTIHEEIGKCNADELCEILEKINPKVIFLEALDDTYTGYQRMVFSSYNVFHEKLEIKAIQKYNIGRSFEYIPVLDEGLPESFARKYGMVTQYPEIRKLVDEFNYLAEKEGFKFLNSAESINHQDHLRLLETKLSIDPALNLESNLGIEKYENSMMRNIYSYCNNNEFNSAIFMCGVAHRKSIIEKIDKFNTHKHVNINWVVYES